MALLIPSYSISMLVSVSSGQSYPSGPRKPVALLSQ